MIRCDWDARMGRSSFLRAGMGAAVVGLIGSGALARAVTLSALDRAYLFLDDMMDRYSRGNTLRLVQSYIPTSALDLNNIAFTYDNAMVLMAYLQRGRAADIARARVLGDAFLYAQGHDDRLIGGRVRNAYYASPFVKIGHSNGIGLGTFTGNLAWTGLALAALARRTGVRAYLVGAIGAGQWIEGHTRDTRGSGGYTGGINVDGSPISWKSTEHNIDVFALFRMLSALSGDTSWSARASHAQTFVHSMWNPVGHHFWTGTGNDGKTVNKNYIPEDVQSWTYLAMREPAYAFSLDWASAHLGARDRFPNGVSVSGVSYSTADRSGVWFEGTAHLAAALRYRNGKNDASTAAAHLKSIELAQTKAPNQNGEGIVAASHNGLATGDGDEFYAALHIGATAWYCLAQLKGNPFR